MYVMAGRHAIGIVGCFGLTTVGAGRIAAPMRVAALLLSDNSERLPGMAGPGHLAPLGGTPCVRWAADALLADVPFVLPVGDAAALDRALDGSGARSAIGGGETWQDSARIGLEALADHAPEVVVLHDGGRPIIPGGTIPALLAALDGAAGAIPALPVTETLLRGDGTGVMPGSGYHRAQTPQAFRYPILLRAHRAAGRTGLADAMLLGQAGHRTVLVSGSEENVKLAHAEDVLRMQRLLAPAFIPRVGTGFDVHALEAGRPLVLCGVTVPHELGLAGHSDADVGIHALCDAIYGALAEGDIGRHFPPSEAAWKDADSARFLRHAASRIAARGGRLANADVTLICEQPKVTPHAPAMIAQLARLLGVDTGLVSVKATTTERLGFAGRGEGIAAQAVVTVMLAQ